MLVSSSSSSACCSFPSPWLTNLGTHLLGEMLRFTRGVGIASLRSWLWLVDSSAIVKESCCKLAEDDRCIVRHLVNLWTFIVWSNRSPKMSLWMVANWCLVYFWKEYARLSGLQDKEAPTSWEMIMQLDQLSSELTTLSRSERVGCPLSIEFLAALQISCYSSITIERSGQRSQMLSWIQFQVRSWLILHWCKPEAYTPSLDVTAVGWGKAGVVVWYGELKEWPIPLTQSTVLAKDSKYTQQEYWK